MAEELPPTIEEQLAAALAQVEQLQQAMATAQAQAGLVPGLQGQVQSLTGQLAGVTSTRDQYKAELDAKNPMLDAANAALGRVQQQMAPIQAMVGGVAQIFTAELAASVADAAKTPRTPADLEATCARQAAALVAIGAKLSTCLSATMSTITGQ